MLALNGADPLNGPRQWGSLLFCLVIVLSLQRAEGSTEETGSSYTQIRILPRLAIQLSLKGPDLLMCFQAHRQPPSPHHLRKHTRSQGPALHQHYPASTVLRPCPTPARAAASRDVEAATLTQDGSPPITRTTFPTCRA